MELDPSFWRGRKVFLTGHTGFKGSWLTLWLQHLGAQVVGYAIDVPTTPSLFELAHVRESMTSIEGDVRDRERLGDALALHQPDVVIHMAAQSLVRVGLRRPIETYEVNVLGTAHVLEAVRGVESVEVVLNVTSDKCYLNRGWEWGYREDDALGGSDPYSSSKACAEIITAAYRASYEDLPRLISARAGNAIGGGDWAEGRLVPDVIRAILTGRPVAIRNPDAVRPWQHVLNPLLGYLLLIQHAIAGTPAAIAWNFGPREDDTLTVRAIVERIRALWGEALGVEAPGEPQPLEAHLLRLDSSRARSSLGWRPRWDLNAGLERTVEWYRLHRDGADPRETTLAQISAFETRGAAA